MPISSVRLRPGVDVEKTVSLNEAGISASAFGRFRSGLFEKIGGWTKYVNYALSGVPKDLQAWQDLTNTQRLGIGTTTGLFTIASSNLADITPQVKTNNSTVDFSTTSGSATVTIIDSNISNPTTFDSVYIQTPVAIGGLVLFGLYPIALVLGATTYTITASSNATSTVSNGGALVTLTTTSGSSAVTVTIANHGLSVGSTYSQVVSQTIGGLTISGNYTVATVPSSSTFTITATNAASSSAGPTSVNSGSVRFYYYITLGPQPTSTGWGIGTWGSGGWGTGSTGSAQTGTAITATNWTLDNWGEILLAGSENGPVYYWQPNSGFITGSMISTGPIASTGCFVSQPAQILVCYGASTASTLGIVQDPLLVRWSDQLNFLTWIATATNQAGSYRIPTGSKIVGAMQAANRGLLWTDLDVYSMTYTGAPTSTNQSFVYAFEKIGGNCGLIAKHARAQLGGVVYWMGYSNFFRMAGGGPQPIPCPVWDTVFQDLNTAYSSKCFAWSNTPFNEVYFFYPSASNSATECDSYVKYNTLDNVWDYGSLGRTIGIDQSLIGYPLATTSAGLIYQHESGYDADTSPINVSMETGAFMLQEGDDMVFVDRIWPDFKWGPYGGAQGAQIQITLYAQDYANAPMRTYGPYLVTQATEFVSVRARGRQFYVKVESSDTGSFWRLGNLRFRYAADGRR